eukprot:TRINITY_DN199_c0_g5_i1.p1 TRINITY_DN199_c0_g5~~TRINITY_DN199_c0_g5_i1.p1  ORF type:complete len:3225 (-),score=1025.87 TRINITY_DN199_c0_g5_i1:69-9743(-)
MNANSNVRDIYINPNTNDLIVAGQFSSVGSGTKLVNAQGLAKANSSSTKLDFTPFLSGQVYSVISANDGTDGLYIGGSFLDADADANADYLAYWDNSQTMTAVGGGGFNNAVYALAMLGNNDLFVGGAFTSSTSASAHRIVKYTRSTKQWNVLDNNALNSQVETISVYDDRNIFVGGHFSNVNSDSFADYLVRYDNQTDSFYRLGGCQGVNSVVRASTINGTMLWFTGSFSAVEGTGSYLGGYDIINKVFVNTFVQDKDAIPATGLSGGTGYAVAVRGPLVVVGGSYSTAIDGYNAIPYFAIWNHMTKNWKSVQSDVQLSSTVYSLLFVDDSHILIGGSFTQDQPWYADRGLSAVVADKHESVHTGNNDNVYAFATLDNQLVVGGGFAPTTNDVRYSFKFGPSGQESTVPLAYFGGAVEKMHYDSALKKMFFIGSFSYIGVCSECRYVAIYNVQTQQIKPIRNYPTSTVYGATTGKTSGNANVLLFGGQFTGVRLSSNREFRRFLAYNLDTNEYVKDTPYVDNTIYAVESHPSDPKMAFVGGAFSSVNEIISTYGTVHKIADNDFVNIGESVLNNQVEAAIIKNNVVYLGGRFTNVGGDNYGDYITTFDIATQKFQNLPRIPNQGSPLNGFVYAMEFMGTDLYIGGSFGVNGLTSNYLVIWDTVNKEWKASGITLSATVYSLKRYSNDILLVGGAFSEYAIKYNITAQSKTALVAGSALNGLVRTFELAPNTVYVGGDFTSAGSSGASRIVAVNTTGAWTYNKLNVTNGPNNGVYTMQYYPGNQRLYIGGGFTAWELGTINRLAQYHPLEGLAPVDGVTAPNSLVYTMALKGDKLYLGGAWTSIAGSTSRDYSAEYDIANGMLTNRFMQGQKHYPSGPSNGAVHCIAIDGDNMFMGGAFTTLRSQSANYLALYNGTYNRFDPLPTNNELNSVVYSLATKGNELFIGGDFTTPYQRALKYDILTRTFKNITLLNQFNGRVRAFLFDGSDIWVGGAFTVVDGSTVNRLVRISSTGQLTKVEEGYPSDVRALSFAPNDQVCSKPQPFATPFCNVNYMTSALSSTHLSLDQAAKSDYDALVTAGGKSAGCLSAYKNYVCGKRFPSCGHSTAPHSRQLCQAVCALSNSQCGRSDACSSLPTTDCIKFPYSRSNDGTCVAVAAKEAGFCASTLGSSYMVAASLSQVEADKRAIGQTHASKTTCPGCNAAAKEYFCHKNFPSCDSANSALPLCKSQCENWASSCGITKSDVCPASMPTSNCASSKVSSRSSCDLNGHPFHTSERNIFAAGTLNQAGDGKSVYRFACYDKATNKWELNPQCGISGTINTVVPDGSTGFYLGGSFTSNLPDFHYFGHYDTTTRQFSRLAAGSNAPSTVRRIIPKGDLIYVAGDFTNAGGIGDADKIAAWNKTAKAWQAVQAGISPSNLFDFAFSKDNTKIILAGSSYIRELDLNNQTNPTKELLTGLSGTAYSVDVVPNTDIAYVGGSFTSLGGVTANRLARWNLINDEPVGLGENGNLEPGLNSRVEVIKSIGDHIFVGGHFTDGSGSLDANRVFMYNTKTNQSNDLGTGFNNVVYSMNTDNGTNSIYIGGSFSTANGQTANYITRYNNDTNKFEPIQKGVNLGSTVFSINIAGQRLYAGGTFASSSYYYHFAQTSTDYNRWIGVGGGVDSTVYDVILDGDNAFIFGSFNEAYTRDQQYMLKINGQGQWETYSPQTSSWSLSQFQDAIVMGEDLYVCGEFTRSSSQNFQLNVMRFRGEQPYQLAAGPDGRVNSLASRGSVLYLGGQFTTVFGLLAGQGKYVVSFDGTRYNPLAMSNSIIVQGNVHQIEVFGDNLYIGCEGGNGCVNKTSEPGYLYGAARYHIPSGAWATVGERKSALENFPTVYAWANVKGNVYRGTNDGLIMSVSDAVDKNIGCGSDPIYALEPYGNGMFVGGSFTSVGIAYTNRLAFYNAETGKFESVDRGGTDGYDVYDFQMHKGKLYVATENYRYTMVMDPAKKQWIDEFDLHTSGDILRLVEYRGELIALTQNTGFGSVASRGMMKVNLITGEYMRIENGTNGDVLAAVRMGNDIYIGGTFTQAGSTYESPRLARYSIPDNKFYAAYTRKNVGSGGLDSTVRAMVAYKGKIFLGGQFNVDLTNGISEHVTRYDPATKTFQQFSSKYQSVDNTVYALHIHNDQLWIGGDFSGTQFAKRYERFMEYNIATGKVKSLGVGPNNNVRVVRVDPSDTNSVYVGGQFSAIGGETFPFIARYSRNDGKWHNVNVPYGQVSTVYDISFTSTDIYAAGESTFSVNDVGKPLLTPGVTVPARKVARFSRSEKKWYDIANEQVVFDDTLYAVAENNGKVCVGGQFTEIGKTLAQRASFFNKSTGAMNGLSKYDGPTGTIYAQGGSPMGYAIGGSFTGVDASPYANYFVALNGSGVYSGSAKAQNWNSAIYAIEQFNGNTLVGGSFSNVDGVASNLAVVNADHKVNALGCAYPSSTVYAIATNGTTDVYVGGSFSSTASKSTRYVAWYDAVEKQWKALGSGTVTGVSSTVRALAVKGDMVYIGGQFSSLYNMFGQNGAMRHVMWSLPDQQNPQGDYNDIPMQAGANVFSTSSSLEIWDLDTDSAGNLYTCGEQSNIVNNYGDYVQKHDFGTGEWQSIYPGNGNGGFNLNSRCYSIKVDKSDNDKLYVGGQFSNYLRTWNPSTNAFDTLTGVSINSAVWALESTSGVVLYGGDFSNRFAVWNATTQTQTYPVSGLNGRVWKIRSYKPGWVVVTGSFSQPYAYAFTYDIKNNKAYQLGSLNSEVRAVHVHGNDVYMGGSFSNSGDVIEDSRYIIRWNHVTNKWSPLDTGVNNAVYTISGMGDYLLVGGAFTNQYSYNNFLSYYVASYQISTNTWSPLGDGTHNYPYCSTAVPGKGIVFAGDFYYMRGNRWGHEGLTAWNRTTNKFVAIRGSSNVFDYGVGTTVYGLHVEDEFLHIYGSFSNAFENSAADRYVVWDTKRMQPVDYDTLYTISSTAWSSARGPDGRMVVGGQFSNYLRVRSQNVISGGTYHVPITQKPQLTSNVYTVKNMVKCVQAPFTSGFCADTVTWTIAAPNAAIDIAAWQSTAESRYNKRVDVNSTRCSQKMKMFACASAFPMCHSDYNAVPVCRSACLAAEKACVNSSFACENLPETGCFPDLLIEDPEDPKPVGPRGLTIGEIIAIVFASLVFVGAVTAVVLYYKHPPFKAWVDTKVADFKQWKASRAASVSPGAGK